jgi:hypothetical protein
VGFQGEAERNRTIAGRHKSITVYECQEGMGEYSAKRWRLVRQEYESFLGPKQKGGIV